MEQTKLVFTRKVWHSASFESETASNLEKPMWGKGMRQERLLPTAVAWVPFRSWRHKWVKFEIFSEFLSFYPFTKTNTQNPNYHIYRLSC